MYPRRRRVNNRAFIKKFVISCEGSVTEKEYFTLLQSFCWQYAFIDILTDKQKSSPDKVLERIVGYGKSLKAGDELWCVIDRDYWTVEQISMLMEWAAGGDDKIERHIAMSNPKFELWLLAHFQSIPATCGPAECIRLLKQYLPEYDKHLDGQIASKEKITFAIGQSLATIPVDCVGTNVGVLVDRITRDAFSTANEERVMP